MHSADDVRYLFPAQYQLRLFQYPCDSVVGAASYENALVSFRNYEALLMNERVVCHSRFSFDEKPVVGGAQLVVRRAGENLQLVVYSKPLSRIEYSGMLNQLAVQPDVVCELHSALIMRKKGGLSHVDRGLGVRAEKSFETAAVVVMAVRYYRRICLGNVYSKSFRVFQKLLAGSEVKQKRVLLSRYVKTETVLGFQTLVFGGVFQQYCDFHAVLL